MRKNPKAEGSFLTHPVVNKIWQIEKIPKFGGDSFWRIEKVAIFGRNLFWRITQRDKFFNVLQCFLNMKIKKI